MAVGDAVLGEILRLVPDLEVQNVFVHLHDFGLLLLLLLRLRLHRLFSSSAWLERPEAEGEELSHSGWDWLALAVLLSFRTAENCPAESGGVDGRTRGPFAPPADGLVRVSAAAPEAQFLQDRWG